MTSTPTPSKSFAKDLGENFVRSFTNAWGTVGLFARYVLIAASLKSIAAKHLRPAHANPSENPPHPEKRSR